MEGFSPELLNAIENLSKRASAKENLVIDIDENHFRSSNLTRIFDDPRPETIHTSSLSSIVSFLRGGIEGYSQADLFLHVIGPDMVCLLVEYYGEEKKRDLVICATRGNDAAPFNFDKWYDTEEFIIGLSAYFETMPDQETILKVASSLVSEEKWANLNEGATMKLTASKGIVNTSEIPDKDIPGVAMLRPFRTFREVQQPVSAFVFRYKSEGEAVKFRLFEADGGAWKHEAMVNIENFFKTQIPELRVIA